MCFWFVPPSLRGRKEDPDYSERLSKVGFLPALVNQLVRFRPLLAVSGMAATFATLALMWGQ